MAIRRLDGTEYKKVVTKDADTTAHMTAKGGYTGLENATGSYLRTPLNGLLPNVSGGSGYVGTSSWKFNHSYIVNGYFDNLYANGVNQNFRYSTGEQWTGQYWIDGAKIYTKTFSFSGASQRFSFAVSQISFIFIDAINSGFKANNGAFYTIPRVATLSLNDQVEINISSSNVSLNFGTAFSNMTKTGYLTIRYTKTA